MASSGPGNFTLSKPVARNAVFLTCSAVFPRVRRHRKTAISVLRHQPERRKICWRCDAKPGWQKP